MAWSFNPFTGNLDLTGSSGAVVFEGEVETFADLPEVVGDPPVGSSYLVRTSTGVWLVNKRQSGIWIRRNNTGVRATDWEYGGDYPVNSVNGQTGNVVLSAGDVGAAPSSHGSTHFAPPTYASFTGSVGGMSTSITITAVNAGPDGNSIGFTFDGSTTITSAVSAWNSANSGNTASITTGDGSQVPYVDETISLSGGASGGSDPVFNQNLNSTDKPSFSGLVVGSEVQNLVHAGYHRAQIVATGSQTPLVLVGGSGTFEFYKDATPSKVISIGFATPGSAAGNNLVFSNYDGSWGSILEVPKNAALDVKTGPIQFADSTDNSKKVLFSAANVSSNSTITLDAPDNSGTLALTSDITKTAVGLGNVANVDTTNAANISSGILDNARVNWQSPSSIGGFNPSSAVFTSLTASNGIISASSAPVLTLSQTWNNAAVTFTALQQTITNTASANGSRLFNFVVGSTSALSARTMTGVAPTEALAINGGDRGLAFGSNTVTNPANAFFSLRWQSNVAGFNSSAILAWGSDVYNLNYDLAVQREAADTFAQRRGSNAQTFRLYNTYTDASNYERGFMRWSSNVLQIGTEKLGTGSARALEFQTDGSTRLTITTGGSIIHGVGTGVIGWNASTILRPLSGDGTLVLYNNAQSDFGRLQFGGTTSSFPALKRSSTTLQVRLADDTAYSVLDAQLRAQGTAPATSGATGTAGDIRYDADYIYVCTAANTWKRAAIATW